VTRVTVDPATSHTRAPYPFISLDSVLRYRREQTVSWRVPDRVIPRNPDRKRHRAASLKARASAVERTMSQRESERLGVSRRGLLRSAAVTGAVLLAGTSVSSGHVRAAEDRCFGPATAVVSVKALGPVSARRRRLGVRVELSERFDVATLDLSRLNVRKDGEQLTTRVLRQSPPSRSRAQAENVIVDFELSTDGIGMLDPGRNTVGLYCADATFPEIEFEVVVAFETGGSRRAVGG
jgi:hypothetical protein